MILSYSSLDFYYVVRLAFNEQHLAEVGLEVVQFEPCVGTPVMAQLVEQLEVVALAAESESEA